MESKLQELKQRLLEVNDLNAAAAILSWDQTSYMPEGGAPARGRQMSLLQRLSHEKFTDEEIGLLLDTLQPYAESLPYDDDDAVILSGRVYTAEEMHAAGVVDVLVEDGTGEAAVQDYIRRNERRRNGLQAVFSCRQHFHPVTHEELLNIANVWVNAALRLEDKDLKLMSRLARSQAKLVPGGATAKPDAVEREETQHYATA